MRVLLLFAGFGLTVGLLAGEPDTGVWRVFGPPEGMPNAPSRAVTLSADGVVWVRQEGPAGVCAFDGYTVRRFAGPTSDPTARVHASRTGQIWSVDSQGLHEFRRESWTRHAVALSGDSAEGSQAPADRPLALLPAERNNVLILLPRTLLKYDTVQRKGTVLKSADVTGLGRFVDCLEAVDGDVWVVGERGVARIPGPVRRANPDTLWEEAEVPESLRVRLLLRATEDRRGGVWVMGEGQESSGRVGLRWDGAEWSPPIQLPAGASCVWRTFDDRLWALGEQVLHRREGDEWREVSPVGLEGAQFFDLAVEPDGAFWVVSSLGLARYAQALWQAPESDISSQLPVEAIVELSEGEVWFAASNRLTVIRGEVWNEVPWVGTGGDQEVNRPVGFGSRLVFPDPEGQVGVVEGRAADIESVACEAGWWVKRVLGRLADGRLAVLVSHSERDGEWRLEAFDGQRLEIVFVPPAEWSLGEDLRFIMNSRGGGIYLGTALGLASWNERAGGFVPVDSYSFGPAVSMVDVGGGRLWCSTGNEILEGDGRTWSLLSSSPGPVARLVGLRDGGIWALSESSVKRFWAGTWIEHRDDPGLARSRVNDLWLDMRGRLWAATDLGIRLHHPEADLEPPQTSIVASGGRRVYSTTEQATLVLRGIDRWAYAAAEQLMFSMRLNEGAWSPYATGAILGLTNLTAGQQRLEVRAMDPALNEEPDPAVFEFTAFVPWYGEPRIVAVAAAGVMVAMILAGLAINRHLRLIRSHSEVERIVEQRTEELARANEELVHSQKMRALGTLAAGIAHDFNAILSIIKGSAQIIEGSLDKPDKICTRVDRIKKMVDQGAGIVKAMLGLSRPSRQEWRTVRLHEFLEDTVRLVTDQLPSGVSIKVEPGSELPPVRVASDLFRQVLFNLILNASEAMAGEGKILLRAWAGEVVGAVVLPTGAKGPHTVVEVLDTGHGIAPDVLGQIFEPFFTTKAFSTRRGTGLGLTMVHEIARELGLGLGVESTPGHGTVFRVYIPLDKGEPNGSN